MQRRIRNIKEADRNLHAYRAGEWRGALNTYRVDTLIFTLFIDIFTYTVLLGFQGGCQKFAEITSPQKWKPSYETKFFKQNVKQTFIFMNLQILNI
jgi:hypothetical protein